MPETADHNALDVVSEQLVRGSSGCKCVDCNEVREDAQRILSALAEAGYTVVKTEDVIDAQHLAHQREWSERTFGPGARTNGVIDHIRKELVEIEDDPAGLEWVDVVILALDGAWRAGHEPQAIIDAIKAKQAKNERRSWPDWRTADPNSAIEHDRSADAVPVPEGSADRGSEEGGER